MTTRTFHTYGYNAVKNDNHIEKSCLFQYFSCVLSERLKECDTFKNVVIYVLVLGYNY